MRHLFVYAALVVAAACSDPPKTIFDARIADGPTGDGASGGPVALPRTVDVGPVDCGGSTTGMFTVTNNGATDVTIGLTSSDPLFTVSPTNVTIVVGTSTTFTVTATAPTGAIAGAPFSTTFTATTNIPGRPTVMIPVTATTRGARVVISPPSMNFGSVGIGAPSTQSFVVSNTGNGPAMVAIAATAGPDAAITFGTAGVAAVGPGALVNGTVTFMPSGLGAYDQQAAITVSGVTCNAPAPSLRVTGTGSTTGGVLITGGPLDFGDVGCGAAETTQTITIDNQANSPTSFVASLPVDPDGDEALYAVTPTSGSVAAHTTATLTVTRRSVARPFVPRAIDATLHIVAGGVPTDVPLRQTVRAPFLVSSRGATNFGFQQPESTTPAPIRITNSGNALATLTFDGADPFAVDLPATVAAGAGADGDLLFTQNAAGTATGTISVDAAEACSNPIAIDVTAGDGPYPIFNVGTTTAACPNPPGGEANFVIDNIGNQPLTVDCVEQGASGLNPTIAPMPAMVAPGATVTASLTHDAGPARAGDRVATFSCTTNEPLTNVHNPTFTSRLEGADIELEAVDPLDFECGDGRTLEFITRNVGTEPIGLFSSGFLAFPLQLNFDNSAIDGGGTELFHQIVNLVPELLRGAPDPCAGAPGGTGALLWEGTIGVAAGSGGRLCGITPATLPVRMFDTTAVPSRRADGAATTPRR